MSKKSKETRENYSGPRVMVRTAKTKCGYCLGQPLESEAHEHCVSEIDWYEKLFVCGCECADEFAKTVEQRDGVVSSGAVTRDPGEDSSVARQESDVEGRDEEGRSSEGSSERSDDPGSTN